MEKHEAAAGTEPWSVDMTSGCHPCRHYGQQTGAPGTPPWHMCGIDRARTVRCGDFRQRVNPKEAAA